MAMQRMTVRLAILFLILGTTTAWSQRHKKPEAKSDAHPSAESRIKPRYSDGHALHDDDQYSSSQGHHGGGQAEEYVDSEDHKSFKEDEETQGAEHSDKNVKDDAYNDHSSKSGHQDFKAGGLTFDKHLKDHKADNKEVENVKEHDIGEKFGGEAVKEHKLGKNKEKSKGHKVHGFKNVYHKEEYGDHKTFHDEFLDSDRQHNYDDHHEHKEMHGGKFSKGFKHEGKNKKYDKGDEKHEWGKAGFDGHNEGKHESGGQLSKHRHGSKKHQAQYDTNYQRNKNAVHKVKKGDPPIHIPHVVHHGPHQAQIEPYVPHHNPHHQQVHIPAHHYSSHGHDQSHQVHSDDDLNGGYKNHGSHHAHEGHHSSTHGGYAQSHGGHHDHDNNKEYTNEEDDHDSDYQERVAKTQHRAPEKEQREDKSEEKSAEKLEPLTQKLEPLSHMQPASQNYGIQQYRQPVYQEQPRFQKPEYFRQEKFSHPFDEKMQTHKERIRYGFQPRSHHHQSHHHFDHQPHYHHHRLHHHPQHQRQPFPRFTGFGHHHHAHGHHQHDAHKKHFSHTPVYHEQSFKPVAHARKAEHPISQPEKNEGRPQYSQRYE